MKKVENFLRKEEDIANWKKYATPEDAEYYECQLELQQDLLKSYNCVERIIGTLHVYMLYQLLLRFFECSRNTSTRLSFQPNLILLARKNIMSNGNHYLMLRLRGRMQL